MTVPEDTSRIFIFHEPSSDRGPFNWQWDYPACCCFACFHMPRRYGRATLDRPQGWVLFAIYFAVAGVYLFWDFFILKA